jgi:hypothetical protein
VGGAWADDDVLVLMRPRSMESLGGHGWWMSGCDEAGYVSLAWGQVDSLGLIIRLDQAVLGEGVVAGPEVLRTTDNTRRTECLT